jgi:hypothetical protein
MNSPQPRITRRTALSRAATASLAAAVAPRWFSLAEGQAVEAAGPPRIWDAHCHMSGVAGTPEERIDALLKYADRHGIQRLIVFMGLSFTADPSPERFRQENDDALRAVEHSQGRVLGFVYLNPKHVPESLQEMDRCVRNGPMVGVKLWIALECSHENLDPIVDRAAELGVPVLQHTFLRTVGNPPGESTPADLAELARRHPHVPMIAAHTGADWEQGVRAIRATKNVLAEVCGSDPTAGMVEMMVRELGAERVVYGSDAGGRSYASQLAKVQGADVSEADKRLILGGNLRRILEPVLKAKGFST